MLIGTGTSFCKWNDSSWDRKRRREGFSISGLSAEKKKIAALAASQGSAISPSGAELSLSLDLFTRVLSQVVARADHQSRLQGLVRACSWEPLVHYCRQCRGRLSTLQDRGLSFKGNMSVTMLSKTGRNERLFHWNFIRSPSGCPSSFHLIFRRVYFLINVFNVSFLTCKTLLCFLAGHFRKRFTDLFHILLEILLKCSVVTHLGILAQDHKGRLTIIEAGHNFMLLTTMMDCLQCNHQTSAKSTVNQLTAYLFPYLPAKWLLLVTACW